MNQRDITSDCRDLVQLHHGAGLALTLEQKLLSIIGMKATITHKRMNTLYTVLGLKHGGLLLLRQNSLSSFAKGLLIALLSPGLEQ